MKNSKQAIDDLRIKLSDMKWLQRHRISNSRAIHWSRFLTCRIQQYQVICMTRLNDRICVALISSFTAKRSLICINQRNLLNWEIRNKAISVKQSIRDKRNKLLLRNKISWKWYLRCYRINKINVFLIVIAWHQDFHFQTSYIIRRIYCK